MKQKASLDLILMSSSVSGGHIQPFRQSTMSPVNLAESGQIMPGSHVQSYHGSMVPTSLGNSANR